MEYARRMLGYFRFLAAAGVLVAHVSNFVSEGTSRAMVTAFFIVSGYLISLTISENYRGNAMGFYRNRFLRLYPIYWVVAGVTALSGARWFFNRLEALPPDIQVKKLIGIAILAFGDADLLIAPAWSLPYEITFYFFAPLVVGLSFGRLPLGILLFACSGIVLLATTQDLTLLAQPFGIGYPKNLWAMIGGSFVIFSLGCAIFRVRTKLSRTVSRSLQFAGICGIVLLLVCGSRYLAPDGRAYDAAYGQWIGIGTYLATGAMLLGWQREESVASKLAGDLTYPVYLVHWPLLNSALFESNAVRGLGNRMAHVLPFGDLIAVSLLALLTSTVLSYGLLMFERRFIAPLRANRTRQEASAPQANVGVPLAEFR